LSSNALTTRDDFEYWIVDMDDALNRFMQILPEPLREKLNYSPASLDYLEAWILDCYPNTSAMLENSQSQIVDGAARYIGETFRRAIGGYWDIRLDDPNTAFFGVPILIGFEERSTPIAPLALATASADRRTGNFIRSVLEN
jgi:hypothetical protein